MSLLYREAPAVVSPHYWRPKVTLEKAFSLFFLDCWKADLGDGQQLGVMLSWKMEERREGKLEWLPPHLPGYYGASSSSSQTPSSATQGLGMRNTVLGVGGETSCEHVGLGVLLPNPSLEVTKHLVNITPSKRLIQPLCLLLLSFLVILFLLLLLHPFSSSSSISPLSLLGIWASVIPNLQAHSIWMQFIPCTLFFFFLGQL